MQLCMIGACKKLDAFTQRSGMKEKYAFCHANLHLSVLIQRNDRLQSSCEIDIRMGRKRFLTMGWSLSRSDQREVHSEVNRLRSQ